ncbi:cyclin-dependent protein kinase regulator pho80 [Lasallia pustulata]|uniref:Cyclin-dependent protein kinase regulator pho80 n=1 Tax=Lasallia pustulata TaxID=136370 RepID=A0A1W5CSZ5_9LECA|nr:cyclin-dependent protein kinase regulator pho80 [Lasallia pustulata]
MPRDRAAHVPAKRARHHGSYHANAHPRAQCQYHYYTNGTWQHPSTFRESRYSDFVPCTYDERTIITRLYKYARTFLAQTNSTCTSLSQRTLFAIGSGSSAGSSGSASASASGSGSTCDIEMISSSPSPTLHAGGASSSTRPPVYYGSYRFSSTNSPRQYIKHPPPAAFPRQPSHSPTIAPPSSKHQRPLSTTTTSSPRATVDAGTQYSPPLAPIPSGAADPPKSRGKRRGTSSCSPEMPPEPALAAQMPFKRSQAASSASQPATASSTTLAHSSSAASSSSQGSSPKRARPAKPAVKYMPTRYETCDVKDLVLLISNMLMELVRLNDDIPIKDGRLTRFHSRAPPGISVTDYLQRLTTHATLSPPILLSMVYYIDRLCSLYPAFTISSLTVHRFLITSATVASKGLSDSFWTNNTYARVGGVSLKELALLELEFLWRVEWRIVPKPEVLVDYYRSLVERTEGFEIEPEAAEEVADGKKGSSPGKQTGIEDGENV